MANLPILLRQSEYIELTRHLSLRWLGMKGECIAMLDESLAVIIADQQRDPEFSSGVDR